MINDLMAAGTTTSVYRVGDFVDLCRGERKMLLLATSCLKLYTDSEEKVWEGCGKMGKGLKAHVPRHSCCAVLRLFLRNTAIALTLRHVSTVVGPQVRTFRPPSRSLR